MSGKLNFLVKIVIPGYLIIAWGAVTAIALIRPAETTLQVIVALLVFGVVGFAVLYFAAMRYMKVSVDERFLYVSNYLKEIRIPLGEIRDVTEIKWARGHPLTIHLATPSKYGRKIHFLPISKGLLAMKSHPFVAELKALAKAAADS